MTRPSWRRRRRDEELSEELQGHLRMAIRDRIAGGESPEEAADSARRDFGNVDLVAEVTRDMWGWRWLDQFARDVRHTLRTMRRSPGYTAIVPTTIIGVVGDVRQSDLVTEIRPMAYWPHPQLPYSAMTLTVRTSGERLAMVPLVEHEIRVLDPEQQ